MSKPDIYALPEGATEDQRLARAEEVDAMAMEIMDRSEQQLADPERKNEVAAHQLLIGLDKAAGDDRSVFHVVQPEGSDLPMISMVRPYSKPWFTPKQVKQWNDAMKRPAPRSCYGSIPMRSLVRPNPPTYDIEVTVTPCAKPEASATSPADESPGRSGN